MSDINKRPLTDEEQRMVEAALRHSSTPVPDPRTGNHLAFRARRAAAKEGTRWPWLLKDLADEIDRLEHENRLLRLKQEAWEGAYE